MIQELNLRRGQWSPIMHLYSWGVTFGWGCDPSPLHPKLEDFHRVPVAPSATLRNHRWCLCERTWKSWMIRISSYNRVFGNISTHSLHRIDVSTALGSPQSLKYNGSTCFFFNLQQKWHTVLMPSWMNSSVNFLAKSSKGSPTKSFIEVAIAFNLRSAFGLRWVTLSGLMRIHCRFNQGCSNENIQQTI